MRSKRDLKAILAFLTAPETLVVFPVLALLVVIGLFIIVTQSSTIAPLIYTLF